MFRLRSSIFLVATCVFLACPSPQRTDARHIVDDTGRREGSPPQLGAVPDALVDDKLRLIGADVPATAQPGDRVRVAIAWRVDGELDVEDAPMLFVHASAPGAELNQAQADVKMGGTSSPQEWREGDVVVAQVSLPIPKTIAVDTLVVRTGLFEGKKRWPVSPARTHTDDRVEIGRIHVEGAPPLEVRADIPKRTGKIVLDGVADEPDWRRAAILAFHPYDGRSNVTRKTSAAMLWDDQALYVSFDVEDPDPFTIFSKRDDPLYDSEATELFIDADGDQVVYVEMQSAANDVHFDAAFAGGRRRNMDKSWDAPFETKTKIAVGKGYVSEWRVPVAALKDIPAGEPKAGASWKVNLFRLERVRVSTEQGARVKASEASAWSPPLSGDFHNLARFGTITFVE